MTNPRERIRILLQEAAEFKRRALAMTPADWEQPSACAGWSCAEALAHLAGQDFALRVTRGLLGDFSPPPGSPSVTEHDEDAFAQSIFQRAFATKEREGARLLDTLLHRLNEAVLVFDRVPEDKWERLCYWPPGPEPARALLDMRISELSMHGWDIFSRFDPEYRLSAGATPVLMDTVPRAVRRAFRPDPTLTSPLRFRFHIDPPFAAVYDLIFSKDGARLETVDPADAAAANGESAPAVTFQCDGETWVMVMYGRRSPDAAIASGQLTYTGDTALAQSFAGRFVGG